MSSILDILAEKDHKLLLEGWVTESKPDLDAEVTLSLLYRGSRDGFRGVDFHAKCDDKGATVTIVKSTEGCIFGGYSDQSWVGGGYYKYSSRAPPWLADIDSFLTSSNHFWVPERGVRSAAVRNGMIVCIANVALVLLLLLLLLLFWSRRKLWYATADLLIIY
jgi:hypothetical protein